MRVKELQVYLAILAYIVLKAIKLCLLCFQTVCKSLSQARDRE